MPKSLAEKLLLKPGLGALIQNAPTPAPLELPAEVRSVTDPASADVLLLYVNSQAELAEHAPTLLSGYRDGAVLWLAYPKKSSKVAKDLSRDSSWLPLEAADFLPVTQIALDETWSALRFRRRGEIKTLTRKF